MGTGRGDEWLQGAPEIGGTDSSSSKKENTEEGNMEEGRTMGSERDV